MSKGPKGEQMLRTVMYQSTPKTEMHITDDCDIMETAWKHNEAMGITGFLLRTPYNYFQVIEGQPEVVDDLILMIRNDTRHQSVEILSDKSSQNRAFDTWCMDYHIASEEEGADIISKLDTGEDFVAALISYIQHRSKQKLARAPLKELG